MKLLLFILIIAFLLGIGVFAYYYLSKYSVSWDYTEGTSTVMFSVEEGKFQ